MCGMTPQHQQQSIIGAYAAIMDEVKIRLDDINMLIGNRGGLAGHVVAESCYLQLRMCCELIALGCLVAHGDIEATKSKGLQKVYSAEKIIQVLAKLHPDFYPEPHATGPICLLYTSPSPRDS